MAKTLLCLASFSTYCAKCAIGAKTCRTKQGFGQKSAKMTLFEGGSCSLGPTFCKKYTFYAPFRRELVAVNVLRYISYRRAVGAWRREEVRARKRRRLKKCTFKMQKVYFFWLLKEAKYTFNCLAG